MFIQIPSKKDASLRTVVSFHHQTQAGEVNSVVSGRSISGATASRITRNLTDYINDLQMRQSLAATVILPTVSKGSC
jgi:hypothetical protein